MPRNGSKKSNVKANWVNWCRLCAKEQDVGIQIEQEASANLGLKISLFKTIQMFLLVEVSNKIIYIKFISCENTALI